MALIKKLLISIFPDILIGWLIALYNDDTGIHVLQTIVLTVLAFQALILFMWFKGAIWQWVYFFLFGQKEMIQKFIDVLGDNDYPPSTKYVTLGSQDYLDAVASDDSEPQELRLKASYESGSYEGLKLAHKLSTITQLDRAFDAAIQFHNNRVTPDKIDDLDQFHPNSETTLDPEKEDLETQLTAIQVLKNQAELEQSLDNKKRNKILRDAQKRIDKAESIVKKAGLNSAISTLINEITHWPHWSQREDFDEYKSFDAKNVNGSIKGEDNTYTVYFDFNESSYHIFVKEINYIYTEELSKSAEVEIIVDGSSVMKAELTYDYDRATNNWSYLNTTKIVVENWMTDFIEIELQVARHAKARHDKMFDGMVLKQARELY